MHIRVPSFHRGRSQELTTLEHKIKLVFIDYGDTYISTWSGAMAQEMGVAEQHRLLYTKEHCNGNQSMIIVLKRFFHRYRYRSVLQP